MASKRSGLKQYLVFISHSHQDRWIAKQFVRLIEDAGKGSVRTFLDEKDIKGGQSIAESIRQEIKQCDEFLVLMSSYSGSRDWVLLEIGGAWALEKLIVAIIDKVKPREMPDITYPYKAIDLNDFDAQYLPQLLRRVAAKQGRRT